MIKTKLMWLDEIIKEWSENKKTGNLQINFFKGVISNVNEIKSRKYEDEVI